MVDTRFKKGFAPWNKGKKIPEISGENHPMFGKYHSKESKKKMSESHKILWQNPEYRKKTSEAHKGKPAWNKGKTHSEESIRRMGESHKGAIAWNKGIPAFEETKEKFKKRPQHFHNGHVPWNAGKHLSEEIRKKLSEVHLGKPAWNKGKKTGKPSWNRGKYNTELSNEKNRLAHLGRPAWNKGKKTGLIPWNKGLQGKLHHSEESKLKIKKRRAKQVFPIKDSLPEIKIQNFLNKLDIFFLAHKHIKEIKHGYQGDIFIPSINLVIECDGDYWHGNTNNPRFKILNKSQIKTKELDEIRTKELIEKGFNVLRLWESDIEKMNLKDFMEKIKPFKKISTAISKLKQV